MVAAANQAALEPSAREARAPEVRLAGALAPFGTRLLFTLDEEPRVSVAVEIMRAFVRLRRILASNVELARKLNELEAKYDTQFKVVFDTIRELMTAPSSSPRRRIGFVTSDEG